MFRPRIIHVLLLKENFLVKSVKFKNHSYIGDPFNTVKLFKNLKANYLVFLNIHVKKILALAQFIKWKQNYGG